jgi:hypothetical protein
MDQWTPTERAIAAAVDAVERAGASIHLTDAVILLTRAQAKVADHVEGLPEQESATPDYREVVAQLHRTLNERWPRFAEKMPFDQRDAIVRFLLNQSPAESPVSAETPANRRPSYEPVEEDAPAAERLAKILLRHGVSITRREAADALTQTIPYLISGASAETPTPITTDSRLAAILHELEHGDAVVRGDTDNIAWCAKELRAYLTAQQETP